MHLIYKQKKTFWRVHPSQLGALSSKECQHWGATLQGKKIPEHLTPSTSKCNKWKAWNSLCEEPQPSQTTPSGEGAVKLSGKYNSASPGDPSLSAKNLVLGYFNSVPSPGYTPLPHKQSSLFSHIHSLRHMPLLFFFALKKKPKSTWRPPLLSRLFLSPVHAVVFCHGSYLFPCRAVCLL